MKDEMHHLVTEQWNPNPNQNDDRNYGDGNGNGSGNDESNKKITIFRTDEDQIDIQGSDDYFLTSANKVHFFAEQKAMDENGQLKPQYCNHEQNKILALNKVGHRLHLLPQSSYETYTASSKIQQVVLDLGWIDPVVPQSMYIFKQALAVDQVTNIILKSNIERI
jgi:phytanoyl-CoA hydroxylase